MEPQAGPLPPSSQVPLRKTSLRRDSGFTTFLSMESYGRNCEKESLTVDFLSTHYDAGPHSGVPTIVIRILKQIWLVAGTVT